MPIPLDEGAPGRRRVGPFWIEEGMGVVALGAAILTLFTLLYVLAVIFRPT